jgi:hypothetical protein
LAIDGVSSSIPSGASVPLATNANYTMRTNYKIIAGHNWMHHHWNSSDSSFKMHKSLFTEPNLGEQKARFNDYDSCTFTNNLGSIAGINIHDPWYRDASGIQPDDFRPFSEVAPDMKHEVFKDQNLYQGTPSYSVKADETITSEVHGQDIDWYFQNWSASDSINIQTPQDSQTAVVFRGNNEALTANYKGHLASNNYTATGYNNGRRIVRTNANTLYLVYEDNNDLWYSKSTDNGASWQPEELILRSNANFTYKQPSITVSTNGTIFFTYIEDYYNDGINQASADILYLSSNNSMERYGLSVISLNSAQYPSVSCDNNTPVITFTGKEFGSSQNRIYVYDGEFCNSINCSDNAKPCILMTSGKAHIVWAENGVLKYCNFTKSDIGWATSSIITLNTDIPRYYVEHNNPSVSIAGNGKAYISWDCRYVAAPYGGYRQILHRVYNFNSNAACHFRSKVSTFAGLKSSS